MCTIQNAIKRVSFLILLLIAPLLVQADTGKENPWGMLGKSPQAQNRAWIRYPIEGFAWPTSVKPGETIKFYISIKDTLGGHDYLLRIFRIPDPQVQFISPTISGNFYPLRDASGNPIYPGDYSRKPVDFKIGCKSFWEPGAVSFTIPSNWPSGLYYAQLNHLSLPSNYTPKYYYVPFVVRAATAGSTSRILFKFDFNTFQAYTYWGGGSLYSLPQQDSTNSLTPTDTLAMDRPLSRDYSDGFVGFATDFIKTLQDSGYVMEYCNNIDIDSLGTVFLSPYKMMVIWNHDEYWSQPERTSTETFKGSTIKGNVARFAPNTCFWRVNWIGADHLRYYCRKGPDYWPDPTGHNPNDLWRDTTYGPGLPEAKLLGEQYETGYNVEHPPDTVRNKDHWIFAGASLTNGGLLGYGFLDGTGNRHGIVSGEVDNLNTARADFPTDILAQRTVLSQVGQDTIPVLHQMIFYEDTLSNARVFAQGSGGWWHGLASNATIQVMSQR